MPSENISMHEFSVNVVYFVKLSLCRKMFTETSFFRSHFQQQWNKHDMLSIAVAFQGNTCPLCLLIV